MTARSDTRTGTRTGRKSGLLRLAPLALLGAIAVGVFALGLHKHISLDALRDNRGALQDVVRSHAAGTALGYVALYTAVVALSLPVGAVLTVAGGLLFGALESTLLTVIGATAGATLLFIAARSAAGDALRARSGPQLADRLATMADGFRKDAFHYLLFLRLVPVFPFWLVNLAPALLGMRLAPYVAATALGIIPGTLVFALFGAGLGEVFDRRGEVSLGAVLTPSLLAGLVGLGLLSLLPIVLRRWRASAASDTEGQP